MKLKFIQDSRVNSEDWRFIGFTKGSDQNGKARLRSLTPKEERRPGNYGTRSAITAIKKKSMIPYGKFFSRDKSYAIYDGYNAKEDRYYPVTETAYQDLYNSAYKFKKRNPDPQQREVIKGGKLKNHFDAVAKAINKQSWLFIQAAGSHAHRMFEDNLANKKFFGAKWKPMAESTAKKRRRLAKMKKDAIPFHGKHKSLLEATGRLKESIKIDSMRKQGVYEQNWANYNAKDVMVAIWTDHSLFTQDYPHRTPNKHNTRYALYHNEGTKKVPRRQFIGIHPRLLKDMEQLMDAHLFYGIFNFLPISGVVTSK